MYLKVSERDGTTETGSESCYLAGFEMKKGR